MPDSMTSDLRPYFRRLLEDTKPLPAESKPEDSERFRLAQQPAAAEADLAVQQALMKRHLDAIDVEFRQNADALSERFSKDEISPGEFRSQMLKEIRFALYSGAAAGAGGVGKMTGADVARVDTATRDQAIYLDRWMRQVERTPNSEQRQGAIQNRARQYGSVARVIAEETFDHNVMRAFPNYPDQLRPRRNTQCRGNCRCSLEWQVIDAKAGDADIFYRLAVSEHCQTCLLRSMAFSPLMIRGFEFINMPSDVSILIYRGVPQHMAAGVQRLVP